MIASATAVAQKNQISITGEGNFNPVTYVYIPQTPNMMGSSEKSSLGVGAEYDRWFNSHLAFGVRYEENPSDGKLLESGLMHNPAYDYGWAIFPQTRYESLGLFTEQFEVNHGEVAEARMGRLTPFIQEGAGAVITDDETKWAKAGWSHSMTFAAGTGSDYWVTGRLAVRISALMMANQTGCYDDPLCTPSWGVSHDFGAGFSYKW